MKRLFVISVLMVSALTLFSQEKVITVGVIDTLETKSGYQINEYYISLTKKELQKYKGKVVRVKGKLLTVKGIDPNDPVIVQGSTGDRKFIVKPKITILKTRVNF
jgi:hypothetical protein